jgi:cytochrome c oxidase subunit 2
MPVVVEVLSADDYAKWVDNQKKKLAAAADDPNKTYTMDELKARGEKVYASNCAVCHQPNGKGAGVFPALDGSKIANGPIAEHVNIVLHGKGAMPPWNTALNDVEIASVVTFERNSWGNHTADILQPMQVADARNGKMPEGGDHLAAAGGDAASAPAAAASEAASAAPAAASDASAPQAAGLPASIYFETGKSTLPSDAAAAVQAAAAYAKAHPDAKLVLSGFTDATGSAEKNAELAKTRAQAVRDALKAAGVAEDRIVLKKPESITGGADAKEARRVEISPAA